MEATRKICNKTNLASFLVQQSQKPEYFVRFADFGSLFITHGMECHKLTAGQNAIDCKQEEADTRILLHASHGHDCTAIKSPDTDVAVHACTLSHSINAMILFCIDTKQRRRYLDMTAIGQSLGEDVCKALPGMHALTGCDSTSAFVGKGKRQAFHYGRVRPKHVRCHDDVRPRQRTAARMCSVRLLTVRKQREDTDRVRYKLFCSKNSQTCNLPPTKDALKYHVAGGNYQACI